MPERSEEVRVITMQERLSGYLRQIRSVRDKMQDNYDKMEVTDSNEELHSSREERLEMLDEIIECLESVIELVSEYNGQWRGLKSIK
jgi:L-lactate utilization protein LutB